MTDERVMALEDVGFIWDSHGSAWMERWNELADYNNKNGHCNVPSNYAPNPQLATWVKVRLVVSISKSQLLISSQYTHCFRSCSVYNWLQCQRRQYKLFCSGKTAANMDPERIQKLESIGFEWELRSHSNKSFVKPFGAVHKV